MDSIQQPYVPAGVLDLEYRWVVGKLQEAVQAKHLCILTGAGVSKAIANLPGWNSLFEGAIHFAESNYVDPRHVDLARRSLEIEPLHAGLVLWTLLSKDDGNMFDTWLAATFKDPAYDHNHEILQVLGAIHQSDTFIRFATTNYDTILDEHLGLQALEWDEARHVNKYFSPIKSRHLLHIHGTYSTPESVVFSSEDYARLAGRQNKTLVTDPLLRLLENYTVLFIGCDGTATDPHFAQVFRKLQRGTAADHVMLYRRAPGDTTPAPNHPKIFSYSHGDYGDLPGTIRKILPDVQTIPVPPLGHVPLACPAPSPTPERAELYVSLELAPLALRRNKELVTEAVKQHGLALQFASPLLRGDKEVVLEAVKQHGSVLRYASPALRGDKDVVLEAVKRDELALQYASPALQGDKDLVLEAVKQHGSVLRYASHALRGDKDVVLEAVKRDELALQFASPLLRGDKEVVLEAVKQHGSVLRYASPALRGDKDVVLEAVKRDELALQYASPALQGDRDIVLEAVKQDSQLLQHASPALQGDKDVVLDALKQHRSVLRSPAPALPADKVFSTRAAKEIEAQRSGTSLVIPPPETGPGRWVNARINEQNRPLIVGEWRSLTFHIAVGTQPEAVFTVPFQEANVFPDGVEKQILTFQVDSLDFDVDTVTQIIPVPRTGPAPFGVDFDVRPKHDGKAELTLSIFKDANFIQRIDATFDVWRQATVRAEVSANYTTVGRPIDVAHVLKSRDICVQIRQKENGYACIFGGKLVGEVRLNISPNQFKHYIASARKKMLQVVNYEDAGKTKVFQKGARIAEVHTQIALETLAKAGALLFTNLFEGNSFGSDNRDLGQLLLELLGNGSDCQYLQFVTDNVPVPWAMLYLSDVSPGDTLDWGHFLGMRHVIEQFQATSTIAYPSASIDSTTPPLRVSLNVNSEIDKTMRSPHVRTQLAWWEEKRGHTIRAGALAVTRNDQGATLIQALKDAATADQILYFYCHARADTQNVDDSKIILNKAEPISLEQLKLQAGRRIKLAGSPLVFINACESAQLSPEFYDGFVPYFMSKGARGVMGTECKMPAVFAGSWARGFFQRFLDGETVGDAVLKLRQSFLETEGNPLGLFYAVYCGADTKISPAPL